MQRQPSCLAEAHRKEAGNIAQLVGFQTVDKAVLLAEAILKQLLVHSVDVAEALAQVAIVTAQQHAGHWHLFRQAAHGVDVDVANCWLRWLQSFTV